MQSTKLLTGSKLVGFRIICIKVRWEWSSWGHVSTSGEHVSNGFFLSLIFTRVNTVFSCDQATLWMVQSARLSVCLFACPSVRLSVTPFSLYSYNRIITKFSGVITNDRSDVHAKGKGQRSKVNVTEVITQLRRFRTVTPVWIHIWWWNDE